MIPIITDTPFSVQYLTTSQVVQHKLFDHLENYYTIIPIIFYMNAHILANIIFSL